jgi:hypothetical protein
LAIEITVQHEPDAMLRNVKQWQREARPVFRTVPSTCVAGFTRATGATSGAQQVGLARPSSAWTATDQNTDPAP